MNFRFIDDTFLYENIYNNIKCFYDVYIEKHKVWRMKKQKDKRTITKLFLLQFKFLKTKNSFSIGFIEQYESMAAV